MFKNLLLVITMLLSGFSFSEEDVTVSIEWKRGPATHGIANKAKIFVPENYVFLGTSETDKYLKYIQNVSNGTEYYFGPDNGDWDAYFSFDSTGYIKDNDEIDADELLKTLKDGDKSSNKHRREQGWPTLTTLGWEFKPRYDRNSNLLEWAFILESGDTKNKIVNYNTRILGRQGVINVQLVPASPEKLHSAIADLKDKLKGFKYNTGERYSEYKEGDRVAEFGLAALITGGAAALASKKGFWATIVAFFIAAKKLVFLAVLGLLAWIVSIFRKK